jgi:hypothetical protein
MTMFSVVPVSVDLGLPESWPVEVLKLAQEGEFWMANVIAPPSVSLAVGVKLYWVPTCAPVEGVPEIVAVAGVTVATAVVAAVDAVSGLTVTGSPPPQAERASDSSAVT